MHGSRRRTQICQVPRFHGGFAGSNSAVKQMAVCSALTSSTSVLTLIAGLLGQDWLLYIHTYKW